MSTASDVIEVVKLVWDVLGPVASKMVGEALAGRNAMDVLVRERIAEIVPEHLKLSLARVEERAKRGLPAEEPSDPSPR